MEIRYFAIATGVVYVLLGLLGFVPGINVEGPSNAPPLMIDHSYGYLFGLFPVNILHNLIHLAVGAWGIVSYVQGVHTSRLFARGLAIFFGVLGILGFIPVVNTVFGLIPIYNHNIWLHLLTAAVAAYFGFFHKTGLRDHADDRAGSFVNRH